VDVTNVNLTSTILGVPTSLPIYITATALGRLAHPDGEQAIVRAAHAQKLVYMLPTLASCTMAEMVGARHPTQVSVCCPSIVVILPDSVDER
jgi:L-lactate dehydrogenase (cytochrome)